MSRHVRECPEMPSRVEIAALFATCADDCLRRARFLAAWSCARESTRDWRDNPIGSSEMTSVRTGSFRIPYNDKVRRHVDQPQPPVAACDSSSELLAAPRRFFTHLGTRIPQRAKQTTT
jgi:hypothetical protein